MRISDRPPGLLARRVFSGDQDRVVIEENWDLNVPGCPMIRNPWLAPMQTRGARYVRHVEMTERQFNNSDIKLF